MVALPQVKTYTADVTWGLILLILHQYYIDYYYYYYIIIKVVDAVFVYILLS